MEHTLLLNPFNANPEPARIVNRGSVDDLLAWAGAHED